MDEGGLCHGKNEGLRAQQWKQKQLKQQSQQSQHAFPESGVIRPHKLSPFLFAAASLPLCFSVSRSLRLIIAKHK